MREVAGDEDARGGGGEGSRIDLGPAGAELFHILAAVFEEAESGGLADGEHHGVAGDDLLLVLVVEGRELAALVVDAQAAAEAHAGDGAGGVTFDGKRTPAIEAVNAFLIAFDDFDGVGGHLFEAFQRDEADARGAGEAGGGTGGVVGDLAEDAASDVVGDVAAADHHNLASYGHGLVERDGAQQVDAAKDAGSLLAGQAKTTRRFGADREDDCGEVAAKLREGDVAADSDTTADLDAESADNVDFLFDDGARQAVSRNADGEHAGGHGFDLEDNGLEAQQGEIVRGGEARRTRANDGHPLAIALLEVAIEGGTQERGHLLGIRGDGGTVVLHAAQDALGTHGFRAVQLTGKALQGADGDGPVGPDEGSVVIHARYLATAAGGFTGSAAHTATDGGERVGTSRNQVSIFKSPFGDGADIAARVGVNRAGNLTRDELLVVGFARHADTQRGHETPPSWVKGDGGAFFAATA